MDNTMTDHNEPATREWWDDLCKKTTHHMLGSVIWSGGGRPSSMFMQDGRFYLTQTDESKRYDVVELGPLTKHRVRELLEALGVKCKS